MRAWGVQPSTPAPAAVFAAPLLEPGAVNRKLTVVCIGAHPDDPETGCGGTLARYAAEGHSVHIIYLTRGEAGVRDGNPATIGQVRTSEALRGASILKSNAHFAGQIDRGTHADEEACRKFADLLLGLNPDIVFTHWPLDTHADHRNAAQLAYQAWQWANRSFTLVYYEVMTGIQTHHFEPNWFMDISATHAQKREAIYAHTSQGPDRFYSYHEAMEKQRGSQTGLERAEAFFIVDESAQQPLIPFEM